MRLVVEHVSVTFERLNALDDVSLTLEPGSHRVLYGRAGSGKTTLLKVLAGLVRPTKGLVHWDDSDVTTLSVETRRNLQAAFGMVFQTDALFDSMSVLDNVRLPLRKRGVPDTEATRRANETLERVGLGAVGARSPEQLSGGMKKRVGIARAIVSRPGVLLADDPFAGLDPDTEASLAKLLIEVATGCTFIAAVPDPTPSLPFEALHLVDGRVVVQ